MRRSPVRALSMGGLVFSLSLVLMVTFLVRAANPPESFVPLVGANPPFFDSLSWSHLSTASGDLPLPGNSDQQVLALVGDIDRDGVNDFVIGVRRAGGPALVWYQRQADGWARHVIEAGTLPLEAGGDLYDVDGDGDLDLVAGSNNQDNKIWWWENPSPDYAGAGWTRRFIKNDGENKHHDMMFGNFDDDPQTEFVFWNQGARGLFIVDVPADPRATQPWPGAAIIFAADNSQSEGLAQADVDNDGKIDIIGGGYWFKHIDGANFTDNLIEQGAFLRVAVGEIIPGNRPEIVQIPGDVDGPGRWFEWDGNAWVGHELPVGVIHHGHSLAIADVNGDGPLDIFIGEMRFGADSRNENADARALLLLGDGAGNFVEQTIAVGFGQHESRVADLDGDGDLDILGKPFAWDTPRLDIWLNDGGGPGPTATATSPVGSCVPLDEWKTHVIDATRPNRAVFVDAADLNGDGRPDVVSGGWWYRNPGQPGGAWQRQTIGSSFDQLAVMDDFDGDGDIDLLGTTWDGANEQQVHKGDRLVWARNDGVGNFTVFDNAQPGNGDFLQGAIVGSFSPGTRQVILSWHNATPLQRVNIPANPATDEWTTVTLSPAAAGEDLSAADIDGDGDLDLFLGSAWLENTGSDWTEHTLHQTNENADRNRAVDLSGDGRPDTVVGYEAISQPGVLAWYEAPADPTQLWTEHVIDTIIGPMSLDVGDVDGDGDPDIVAGEHNKANPQQGRVFVYENINAGFQRHQVAVGDEHHDGTQLVDIDGDSDLDIISIGWEHGRVLLYEFIGCAGADPVETPTPTATLSHTPTPTATSADSTPTPTATSAGPTPTLSVQPGEGHLYYFSSTTGGNVGGVKFADEDVLQYDQDAGEWTLFFDGSDVGFAKNDVDAFHLRADGSLLISLLNPATLGALGSVDDSDLLTFTPTSLGANTAGTFALYFDGSDVGLTTSAEDVDGVIEMPDGQLLLTTSGKATVPGVTALNEDLLAFSPAALGGNTTGSWSLFFQGADIGLSAKSEDVSGAVLAADRLYLTTGGAFQIDELSGGAADVIHCHLASGGTSTSCFGAPSIHWWGSQNGFGSEIIDALAMSDGSEVDPPPSPTPTSTSTPAACSPGSIGSWSWSRQVIDPNKPGRAAFIFNFDIDGDGKIDILTGKYWYRNPGQVNGVWTRSLIGAALEDTAAVYDFDGDGDLDLFGTTGPTLPPADSQWSPFVWGRNEGGGVFTILNNVDNAGLDLPTNDPIQGVVVDRFHAGGALEIAVTWDDTENPKRNPYGVQMFTVPADPSAQTWARRKLSDVSTGEQLSAADLDNDADLDLFLGSKWLRNNHPTNSWTPFTLFDTTGSSQASRHALTDIDGDGDLDAFVGYSHEANNARVMWYEQVSSPTDSWQGHLITSLPRGDAESLDVFDMDGDGDPDVIVGEYNHSGSTDRPGSLFIFENLGQGESWATHEVFDGDSHYQASRAADMDGDGDLDIISKNWWHFRVLIYENRADECE